MAGVGVVELRTPFRLFGSGVAVGVLPESVAVAESVELGVSELSEVAVVVGPP